MNEKVARRIKKLSGWTGDAYLYSVVPSMPDVDTVLDADDIIERPCRWYDYVVVTATYTLFGCPETYIFGSDRNGYVLGWGELDGSFQGELNHDLALARAGYRVLADDEVTV